MPLAAGGMARIYIGRSTGIGSFERHVVLKMITPERASDQTAVNMFLDEARLAASLNHQNVAQVFEVGEDSGIHYLAMEYVHGQDLRAVLAKAGSQGTRIPLELALTVVAGAAAGLHHAHERRGPDGQPLGIVHRDVSPSNIMIGYDGAVKLLDFGIAKATARSVETQSGIIKGKFAYMAPEQCRGRDVDRRSDVFSLGIILYEISTQHRCFRADSDFDTMHRIVTGDVVRPTRLVQGYPQALEAIVMKALAVDAAQRYQSSGLLLEALESFAVASRMSLSTMGLGRFMRDMFGEVQEPWLNTAATKVLQPIAQKEGTISSTNGSKQAPVMLPPEQLAVDTSGIPDDEARFADSDGINSLVKTTLDLPREHGGNQTMEDPPSEEWSPKSYPTTPAPLPPPVYPGAPRALQPGGLPPPPRGSEPMTRPTPPPGAMTRPTPQPMTAAHSPELPLPPPPQPFSASPSGQGSPFNAPGSGQGSSFNAPGSGQGAPFNVPGSGQGAPFNVPGSGQGAPFNVPGSGSGQAHAFSGPGSGSGPAHPGIPSTKHGYASAAMTRGDVSYPQYALETPDVQLKPNRRPLFIGLGIVIVGVIVMLAVSMSGGDETPSTRTNDQPTPTEPSQPTEQNHAATPEPAPSSDTPEVSDDSMVSVIIHSDPPGADVLIAGTKIGTTPFESKLKRGTKIVQLTVQKDGFAPFNGKIDLSGEYENRNIKLVHPEDLPKGSDGMTVPAHGNDAAKTGEKAEKSAPKSSEKSSEKTTEKTTSKATTEKTTSRPTTEKSSTKASTKGTTEKATPPKVEKEKCQPPGPNVDPFGAPICKT
jgi:serine/threonine-protein kinase